MTDKDLESAAIVERVERRLLLVRGERVLLDQDLAELYGVETRILIRAVRRNLERFPADFMIRLTKQEAADLISHFGISSWGGRRTLPYAFTEQGVAMLSSVLRSERAVRVNIEIMRAFVRMRRLMAEHEDLARRLTDLEHWARKEGKQNELRFQVVFDALAKLRGAPVPPERRIGFTLEEDKGGGEGRKGEERGEVDP